MWREINPAPAKIISNSLLTNPQKHDILNTEIKKGAGAYESFLAGQQKKVLTKEKSYDIIKTIQRKTKILKKQKEK